jgi:hypothetical protein
LQICDRIEGLPLVVIKKAGVSSGFFYLVETWTFHRSAVPAAAASATREAATSAASAEDGQFVKFKNKTDLMRTTSTL